MDRRRLVLATYLAEAARPLTIVACVAIFAAVFGLVSLASQVLQAGVRSSFVWLLSGVFVVPYAVKVAQIYRALRPPGLKSRGVRIERAGAERLHALVEQTTVKLGVPPPNVLWIAMSFDLGVVPTRDGYALVIGLALLDAVSPGELRALVATALARSFTGDKLAARAYRATMRWVVTLTPGANKADAGGANVAAVIAAGCLRALDAEHLVAEREKHAREDAGRIVPPADVRAGLVRASMYESYADEVFWPRLAARHTVNDPPDGISQLRAMCRTPIPEDERRRRRNRAEAELGLGVDRLVSDEQTARASASDLLEVAPTLTRAFDEAWRAAIAPAWSELRRAAAAQTAEFDELQQASVERELTEPEAWRRLELIEAREGAAAVVTELLAWTEDHPSDAQGLFHAGRVLLSLGREPGIPLLERALELDERYTAEATALMAAYLRGEGRETDAKEQWTRHETAIAVLQSGLTERAKLAKAVPLAAHGLRAHEVDVIVEHLRRFPMVSAATLARGETSILPKIPLVLVGVRFKRDAFWWNLETARDVLPRIADIPLPIQVIPMEIGGYKPLRVAPAVEIYRAVVPSRGATLARWGRRGQVALIVVGVFFVLRASFNNRDCFPDCWLKAEAFLYLIPLIAAVNVLLLTGSPDTWMRRAAAFLASLFFVSELAFSGWWTLFMPFALVALLRTPTTRRSAIWTIGMSLPALALGMITGLS